ncbi:DNA ligase 4 [Harpegnathos saltator]|uniref:DNA ligase IV n=1 Tax=Harpegnathos saltator TaxID=610380 RepID=E2BTB8_HARSA|nr:DNA ligase 4 [Harpegnathos saltator]
MDTQIEDFMEFTHLCEFFEKVRTSRIKKEKIEILKTFFNQYRNNASKVQNTHGGNLDEIMYPILRLILPKYYSIKDYDSRKKETKHSLTILYANVCQLSKQSDDYKALVNSRNLTSDKFEKNDFAECAYFVFQKFLSQHSTKIALADINKFLDDISNKKMQQKIELFRLIFRRMTGFQMKWLTRIILQDLQLGIKAEDILDVLDIKSYNTSLRNCTIYDSSKKMKQNVQLFSHFKPMLLERLSIDDICKLFSTSKNYYVQTKYDGERSQIHMSHGRYKYFTRNGFEITKKPLLGGIDSLGYLSVKFAQFLDPDCTSFILDGELMVWNKKEKALLTKGMKVDVKFLQTVGPYRPCFIAFDIIMYNDISLLDIPYHRRLKQLENLLIKAHGAISACETTPIDDRTQLEDIFRSKCLQGKEEGIVVKRHDFLYKPNVRDGGGCYKIKAEYSDNLVQDLDLIILGGSYTKNKFPKQLNSLIMGAAIPASSEEEHPSSFMVIVSVSNGLSKEEWNFLEERFSSKWVEECPENILTYATRTQSDMWLRPEDSMILTIRATEMVPSNKHLIGYSFRFPRVMHIRQDKPWYSACTNKEILSLVKNKKAIHKLIKPEANLHNNEDLLELSGCTSDKPRILTRPWSGQIAHVAFEKPVIHTRLLEGKEICVINGTDDFSKEDIEKVLMQHSANIVSNPISTTYCTIVGKNNTIRALDVIKNHDNVVSFDWFLRVTSDQKSSISIHPWELLSKSKNPSDSSMEYDIYYDYYYIDATASTLQHSFARIDELVILKILTLMQKSLEIHEKRCLLIHSGA